MWNPKRSLSKVSSSDKQNIKEVGDVNYCKNSAGVEQFEDQQQQKENSEQQTSRFGGQLSGSTYIHHKENGDGNRKRVDLADETVDSGFISGPQTASSGNLNTQNEAVDRPSCEIHNESEVPNLNSGIVEKQCDDSECDLNQPTPVCSFGCRHTGKLTWVLKSSHCDQKPLNEPKMILSHSGDSGLSEWFCNLSWKSNPNALNSETNPSMSDSGTAMNNLKVPIQPQSTIPQQITQANAWRKYYRQDDHGNTSLHLACISGSEDDAAALIRMAPYTWLLNTQNNEGHTPLHLATLAVQPKIIRMLLIAGAGPAIFDSHGNTALHLACMSGKEQCVRALIVPISASEVNEAHRQYGHRFIDCYLKCYLKCAKLPSGLEFRTNDKTSVHLAAEAGFRNIVYLLVSYGADINARKVNAGRRSRRPRRPTDSDYDSGDD